MPHTAPVLEIAGKRAARIGKVNCSMQDIAVGREFATGGYIYQAHVTQRQFAHVPLSARFRRDGKWYKRVSDNSSKLLDPNMPFADPCGVTVNIGGLVKVDVLEWTLRGRDERAVPTNAESTGHMSTSP